MGWMKADSSETYNVSYSPSKLNGTNVAATPSLMYKGDVVWSERYDESLMLKSPVKYKGAEVPRMRYRGVDVLHRTCQLWGTSCGNWLPYEAFAKQVVQRYYPNIYQTDGGTLIGWNEYTSACTWNYSNEHTLEIRSIGHTTRSVGSLYISFYKCSVSAYLNSDAEDIYYAKDANGNGIRGTEYTENDLHSWWSSCKEFYVGDNDDFYYIVVNARGDLDSNRNIYYDDEGSGSFRTAFGQFYDTWSGPSNLEDFATQVSNEIRSKCRNLGYMNGIILDEAVGSTVGDSTKPSFRDVCRNIYIKGTKRKFISVNFKAYNRNYKLPMNSTPTGSASIQENYYGSGYNAYARDSGDEIHYQSCYPYRGSSFHGFFNWAYSSSSGSSDGEASIRGVSSCYPGYLYQVREYYLNDLTTDIPSWLGEPYEDCGKKLFVFNMASACSNMHSFSAEWKMPIVIAYEPRYYVNNEGSFYQRY